MFHVFSHAIVRGGRLMPARPASIGRTVRAAVSVTLLGAVFTTAFAASTVTVHLSGDIVPECAISGSTSFAGGATLGLPLDIGDISKPGHRDYAFGIDCNAPFAYRLEAQYGALTQIRAMPAPQGFSTAVPYEVAVYIPTDGSPIDDRCPSASIAAGRALCPFSTSGNNIALGVDGRLTISWIPQTETLAAGDYVDRLTLKVAPSL